MACGTIRLLTISALAACGACAAGDESADASSVSSVYVAVLRHLDTSTSSSDDDRPIVYVADMNSEPLDLDEQVEVIGALDAEVDVRFVDDIDAAAMSAEGAFGASDGGWLVAIGTPVEDAGPGVIALRVEASEPDDDPTAWQFRLDVDEEITVVDAEELDPELLVPPVSP